MTHGQVCPTAENPSSVTICWHAGLANGCVTLPLVFALRGVQPGIHKVFHPLCISMSKIFTVFEQMPCSHITAPLAMIPANSWNFVSPEELHLWRLYLQLTSHTRKDYMTPVFRLTHGFVLCITLWMEGQRQSHLQLLFVLVLVSIQDSYVGLCKFGDRVERWWSSSEPRVTGHVVTLWNAHPGVSLFQTVCLRYDYVPFFRSEKEMTVS